MCDGQRMFPVEFYASTLFLVIFFQLNHFVISFNPNSVQHHIKQLRSSTTLNSITNNNNNNNHIIYSSIPVQPVVQGVTTSSTTVCRTVGGLTKSQLELCYRHADVAESALMGLQLAIDECQHQFQWHRWNCSSLSTKNKNPHSSVLLQKGYRETAFAYAISAAGVAHSVARACSQGKLLECGCDPAGRRMYSQGVLSGNVPDTTVPHRTVSAASRWKWGGCSHNLHFGVEFSKLFLDSREQAGDIHSQINLHNNQAGRLAVANNMQVRCKCHGMSGSCQLKTCWKSAPDFRVVGKILKERFRQAILVDQSNLGNGTPLLYVNNKIRGTRRGKRPPKNQRGGGSNNNNHPNKRPRQKPRGGTSRKIKLHRKRDLTSDLLYYQRSPNFCEKDVSVDVPGTVGRRCNRTSTGGDGCASLCCGRGYNIVRQRRTERCHCRFHWCCFVECQNCTYEEWITVCK